MFKIDRLPHTIVFMVWAKEYVSEVGRVATDSPCVYIEDLIAQ